MSYIYIHIYIYAYICIYICTHINIIIIYTCRIIFTYMYYIKLLCGLKLLLYAALHTIKRMYTVRKISKKTMDSHICVSFRIHIFVCTNNTYSSNKTTLYHTFSLKKKSRKMPNSMQAPICCNTLNRRRK